jgi:predicted nucleic acid-binding protein
MAGGSTAKKPTGVRSFIDTNLLVYADAADEPAKQAAAVELLVRHRKAGTGVVSTQVLQEFANVGLRKLRMPPTLVRERLAFYERFEVVPVSPALVMAAVDLHAARGVSFYDALIVQSAVAAGCGVLLSEDMQHGATFSGLRIVDPFQPA